MLKVTLLILLGFLWSARLTAIKAAGLSGIPVHVTIILSTIGIAFLFSFLAVAKRSWPPLDTIAVRFYILSGLFGFILPFILENLVARHLTVFLFIVIIATMPIMTLILATVLRIERLSLFQYIAIGLGFLVALLIALDTAGGEPSDRPDWLWLIIACGVPLLYAGNTLFVASRWPPSAEATHVAQAQALIVSFAAVAGSLMTGSFEEWHQASNNLPAISGIAFFEGAALLVYLKITRDYGATFVSLANYVAMVFAALLGTIMFGDQLTWLSIFAAILLVLSLTINQVKKPA